MTRPDISGPNILGKFAVRSTSIDFNLTKLGPSWPWCLSQPLPFPRCCQRNYYTRFEELPWQLMRDDHTLPRYSHLLAHSQCLLILLLANRHCVQIEMLIGMDGFVAIPQCYRVACPAEYFDSISSMYSGWSARSLRGSRSRITTIGFRLPCINSRRKCASVEAFRKIRIDVMSTAPFGTLQWSEDYNMESICRQEKQFICCPLEK
jgi:hypothetical protein